MRRPVKKSYCGREINPTDLTSLENNKFLPKTDVFGGPPCLDIEKCIENASKDPNHRTPQFLIMNGCVASQNWPFDASDRVFAPYNPWTIIPVQKRNDYMQSLEAASVHQDIKPFTNFLATLVTDNIEGKPGPKVPAG